MWNCNASQKENTCGELSAFPAFCLEERSGLPHVTGNKAHGENSSLAGLRRQRLVLKAVKATEICRAVYQREGPVQTESPESHRGNLHGSLPRAGLHTCKVSLFQS